MTPYYALYSVLLNYTSNGLSTWYNLDGSNNITINSPTYFSTTEGEHTLYLYANDSTGEIITRNTTFYVNSSLITILYEEYSGAQKGISTIYFVYILNGSFINGLKINDISINFFFWHCC